MKNIRRLSFVLAAFAFTALMQPAYSVQAQSIEDAMAAAEGSGTAGQEGTAGTENGNGAGESAESGAALSGGIEDAGRNGNADANAGVEGSTGGNGNSGTGGTAAAGGDISADGNIIADGVYIGTVNVSGMTADQAMDAVEAHIEELKARSLTLDAVDGNQVTVTVGELGLLWGNPEAAKDAVALGKKGNVIQRYKALQDLKHENHVFELDYHLDKELIRQLLTEQCSQFNAEAKDAELVKTEAGFSVTPGTAGYVLDEEASLNKIYDYFTKEWNLEDARIELAGKVDEPRGTEEELAQVKDVLGTFSTNFSSSGSNRSANVANGCHLIAGTTLYPGDEFSTYEAVSPFSKDNGYFMAGSYLNGQVVDSLGGGICQVSTTLYNAVLLAELEVTERHNHSMIVSYVDPSADAAIAESAGKDFKFINNTQYPIYIDGYVVGKDITFTIYGVETRPANRQVKYESNVLSVIRPESDVIYTDVAMPIGKVVSQSAHIGYKAELWKVVTEDGVEVSREQMNSSSYKMVPRTATVGLSTNDVNAYNEMLAAVATNNIDHVKNVAAALAQFAIQPDQQPVSPEQPPAEQQAPPAEQPPAEQQAPPAEQPPAEQQAPPAEQPPAEPQPEG